MQGLKGNGLKSTAKFVLITYFDFLKGTSESSNTGRNVFPNRSSCSTKISKYNTCEDDVCKITTTTTPKLTCPCHKVHNTVLGKPNNRKIAIQGQQ